MIWGLEFRRVLFRSWPDAGLRPAPGELHDLGRVEDQHLAIETVAGRTDEPQRRARPALADDLLGIPGGQVLWLGHGPPDLLARVRQLAGEGAPPPPPLPPPPPPPPPPP